MKKSSAPKLPAQMFRYRVAQIVGPPIAKIQVGTILVDRKKSEGYDEKFPLGYRTWFFFDFKSDAQQYVVGEFIGARATAGVTINGKAPIVEPQA